MIPRPLRRSLAARAAALAVLATTAACGLVHDDTARGARPDGPGFSVAAAGDILIHPQLVEQARKDAKTTGKGDHGLDFGPMMRGVRPVISKADLAVCHFEAVAGKPGGPFEGFPDFQVPPQIATTAKAIGYDTCSTASNHTLDHGYRGVVATLGALDKAGLGHTGSARSAGEAAKPLITEVKGVKVAQLSYAFGFNGNEIPAGKPWLANRTAFKDIAAAERRARKAGAEVVILSIHWGREYQSDPSRGQLSLARRLARETGIDLIVGHHAHVVQPMEKVDGTWIAYGLGNQIARHDVPTGLTEEGVIGWFDFTRRGGSWAVSARYVPTLVTVPPAPDDDGRSPERAEREHRLIDVAARLRTGDGLSAGQRARYRLAFERTEGTLLNRGAARDGLRPLEALPD
ncbi:CapA family protein [Streptomyces sp. NPDC058045]|uniref:CapA family protein n=1 Tax=Streptomyces sp. NPDC058045 TaxID=3346311 RepID=UPI0036EC3C7D